MDKLISFIIPCFNSESYMEKCLNSLLINNEQIEIIIINDGSRDNTETIALKYKDKYPNIIKYINQKNNGYGECINQGLKISTGKYIKVINSDDWLELDAYNELLNKIDSIDTDIIITNYINTYKDNKERKIIKFNNVFEENKELKWENINKFKRNQHLSIYSLIFKNELLNKCNINLPKHCKYTEELLLYIPLKYINTIYYLNINLYNYYKGLKHQSIYNEYIIKNSYDLVTISNNICNLYDIESILDKNLYKLMKRHCIIITSYAILLSRLNNSNLGEKQYKELLLSIKNNNSNLYKKIRYNSLITILSIPGIFGLLICKVVYKFINNN